jgi:hypothetical protein
MVDDVADSSEATGEALRDVKAEYDERRLARGFAIGLPVVTLVAGTIVGVLIGTAQAILVLAAGILLGVIALFWASLRVLSGDATLSPELEALDATANAVDVLASRKRMLIRALKDLDNERALGKLEEEDHEQLTQTYRAELKDVMRRVDASLAPHRPKAEDEARAYLVKAGFARDGVVRASRKAAPVVAAAVEEEELEDQSDDELEDEDGLEDPTGDELEAEREDGDAAESEDAVNGTPVEAKASSSATKAETNAAPDAPTRVTCSACSTSNEIDASFCKKCGASLAKDASNAKTKANTDEA